jgi:MFS family permease
MAPFRKDLQYYKFCAYGFLKNLRLFEPFLILFLLDKELGFLQIGIVYTIREITRNVFEIPAGLAADVLGRKRTMVSSFSLYILSFILYTISPRMGGVLIATAIFGLADAFRTGTHKAMIFSYLQRQGWAEHKVSYYGHTRSWSQTGAAISALVAGGLVFYSGEIGRVFIYSVIPYVLGLLLMLSYPGYLDGKAEKMKEVNLVRSLRDTVQSFWMSFRNSRILKGILNASVYSGYYRALKDYLQPVIQAFALGLPVMMTFDENQKSALLIGSIYFLVYILSSAVTRQSGKFAGRFRGYATPLNLTLLAGFCLGALCGIVFIKGVAVMAIVLFVGIYLVENLRLPAGISYFTENIEEGILATTLSAESQGKSLFTAVIALVTGFLADRFDIGTAILAVSVLMILTLPFYLIRDN